MQRQRIRRPGAGGVHAAAGADQATTGDSAGETRQSCKLEDNDTEMEDEDQVEERACTEKQATQRKRLKRELERKMKEIREHDNGELPTVELNTKKLFF